MPRIYTFFHQSESHIHLDLDQLESITVRVGPPAKAEDDALVILTFKSGQRTPISFESKSSAVRCADDLKAAWNEALPAKRTPPP